MGAQTTQRSAAQVREHGNELYKKGALNEAIAAYREAAALNPSDPLPLSNLSAAYFEAGSYFDCVQAAKEALETSWLAADTQSVTAQKLFIRSVKSLLHLAQLAKAKELVGRILPGKDLDGLLYALQDASGPGAAHSPKLREKLLGLPRLRPRIQDVPDYFGPGHDEAESLFTPQLNSSCCNEPILSFMLCGVGDARHLFKTIGDYYSMENPSFQKVHFSILDNKPAVLARVLIFLSLMQEAKASAADHRETSTYLLPLAYIFCTQLLPPSVTLMFHKIAGGLRSKLQKEESPVDWIHVQPAQMRALDTVLHQWQGILEDALYPTVHVRRLISTTKSPPNQDMGTGEWHHVPECELEHNFFEDFSVLLPPREFLENTEPDLANLVSKYRNGCSPRLRQQIERHLNMHWSVNPTVVDLVWEVNKEEPGPPDFGGFDPFHIIEALRKAAKTHGTKAEDVDAITFATDFFRPMYESMHRFQNKLMIEVIVGDMMEVMERIRYNKFLRPEPTSPKKYHVIHMSNIPDYVGGALTSFVYAVPLLEKGNGTGLTSVVMRNPPQWKNVDQFNAEYLLMHDRDLIQKHFAVKLSSITPEGSFHDLFAMFPLLDYKMWESVGRHKLSLTERLPREKLFFWLYSIFFKVCLPFPRSVPNFSLVYAPFNMTAFMRILDLVTELGYSPHWISIIVCAIASGEITTTARAPRKAVLTPGAIDRTHDSRMICVRPWADEFTSLVAMWRGVWPDGTLVVTRDLLPSLGNISEYSIQFPKFTAENLSYPHFALVFWNQGKYGNPPRNLRPVLLTTKRGIRHPRLALFELTASRFCRPSPGSGRRAPLASGSGMIL